ncbi:glycosyltransferase family 4 protein [Serratia surfactantfaciens]|uniref:glycosyltransferase family 4 protein n=1 Tax=Serratia surfactantfaciens TaxID=2741499 RepID=UPI001B3C6892|nr:glycosyltransferase family 1 protein [Serratia surfactantfaciens]
MIYINARFLTQELTGVQRFAEQICLELQKIRSDIIFLAPEHIARNDAAEKFNVKVIGRHSGHLWEQFDLPRFLRSEGSPLLINLGNTGPIFYKNQVVTQHDVTYRRYPQSYSWKFKLVYNLLVPSLLRRSKSIITVSNFSKSELTDIYQCDSSKVHVVYNSASDIFRSEKKSDNQEKYVLAVSSTNYHKNFHGLIREFTRLSRDIDVNLKIIGGAAKSFSNMDLNSYVGSDDRVEFVGRVTDEQLLSLYVNAMAFVFPSFYEGFGIPPLEAQACGCPVISSNLASMPEVLGDSALYFNPEKDGEMTTALQNVFENKLLRDKLIEKGYKNIAKYSWHSSARKLSSIIDQLQLS